MNSTVSTVEIGTESSIENSITFTESEQSRRERQGVLALASWYMARKGNADVQPVEMSRLVDVPCWYLQYDLPEGELELEVYYSPTEGWQTKVTTFVPRARVAG